MGPPVVYTDMRICGYMCTQAKHTCTRTHKGARAHGSRKGEAWEIKSTQKCIIQLKHLALLDLKEGLGLEYGSGSKALTHIHETWSLIPRGHVKRLGLTGQLTAPTVDL